MVNAQAATIDDRIAVRDSDTRSTAAGQYDYIIAGAGCAGLSLLMRLLDNPAFADKKILLLDKDAKKSNDRTWCFWEESAGFFEPVVYCRWNELYVYGAQMAQRLDMGGYQYKLVRGADFYRFCFDRLALAPNVHFEQAEITEVGVRDNRGWVTAGGKTYGAAFVFNSIMPAAKPLAVHQYWLLQHFKGWIVETEADCFDPHAATLMDFRVPQQNGTTFVYVLPFGPRRALVEYTLFSGKMLSPESYDAALAAYMEKYFHGAAYRVADTEFGVIPMTNYPFERGSGQVCNIGTAGGNTKASSGYTFQFIQKGADAIVRSLLAYGHPFSKPAASGRFGLYDSVLLHLLRYNQIDGAGVFTRLFARNKAHRVFRFLDNDTSFSQDLGILFSLPIFPFTKAALAHILRRVAAPFTKNTRR